MGYRSKGRSTSGCFRQYQRDITDEQKACQKGNSPTHARNFPKLDYRQQSCVCMGVRADLSQRLIRCSNQNLSWPNRKVGGRNGILMGRIAWNSDKILRSGETSLNGIGSGTFRDAYIDQFTADPCRMEPQWFRWLYICIGFRIDSLSSVRKTPICVRYRSDRWIPCLGGHLVTSFVFAVRSRLN